MGSALAPPALPVSSRSKAHRARRLRLALAVFWSCATLAPAALAAPGQPARHDRHGADETASVLHAVDTFFAAVRTGNADLAASILSPDGMLFFQRRNADGGYRLHHKSNSRWLEEFRGWTGHMEDRPSRSTVRVWGPVATVSHAFVFRLNGRFSHCGMNLIQLVRVGRDWRIANIVWTEEHSGCA